MLVPVEVPKGASFSELEAKIRAATHGVSVLIADGRKMFVKMPKGASSDTIIRQLSAAGVVIQDKGHH